MSAHDVEKTLSQLKDFQRDTAKWVFQRLFDDQNPTDRFLVADEVGLGKTIVAKGVVAQVLDHLQNIGDKRHDIVYICSNSSIARQNIKKLVPNDVSPLDNVERLTMLPIANLSEGTNGNAGINLLAISPGTSFAFGRKTGKFPERVLAYAFVRELWGKEVTDSAPARKIFWAGVGNGEQRLRERSREYRAIAAEHVAAFRQQIEAIDVELELRGRPTLRKQFENLTSELKFSREIFPSGLNTARSEVMGGFRRALATLGINMLKPDLIILDEFQRFKDLMDPKATDWASTLARQLFTHRDDETGRGTKVLLLSATPYRMYARTGESDDHFADFLNTCSFLFNDQTAVDELKKDFNLLRLAMTNTLISDDALEICRRIQERLSSVMARTERLSVTPDRNGMLQEFVHYLPIDVEDLKSYARVGNISEVLEQNEPIDYWKSSPYLFNFMDNYKLKTAYKDAVENGALAHIDSLAPGPGFINHQNLETYQPVDAQNARLRWLISDLDSHRAFELLWIPPSLRYYDSGSIYESDEARSFTKRVIFSGWTVVPKSVASLTSFEAERKALLGTRHKRYDADNRGQGRLNFRVKNRKPMSMNTFALIWPSVSLAKLGEHKHVGPDKPTISEVRKEVSLRVAETMKPTIDKYLRGDIVDRRWYWLAPLLLDRELVPSVIDDWWGMNDVEEAWSREDKKDGLLAHSNAAWEILDDSELDLGAPPDDLIDVLTEMAIGGPAICALRAIAAVSGLPIEHHSVLNNSALIANSFRKFFNKAEPTAVVLRNSLDSGDEETFWRATVRYCTDSHLQALLDEHIHTLRDWLGFNSFTDESSREKAVSQFAEKIDDALSSGAVNFGLDIPDSLNQQIHRKTIRANFAAAFGQRGDDEKSANRNETISTAFNSPFWPFVLVSTSIGQEGLDFHLWSHSVVHWNLPSNPVDLEQREGRVHRYKGHVVRKNIAESLSSQMAQIDASDIWQSLFDFAAQHREPNESEMVPYWVYPYGSSRIERHVPLLPFSKDASDLPRLKNSLAAYRLAFGQPRQEDLVNFLQRNHSEEEIETLVQKFQINLSPPAR